MDIFKIGGVELSRPEIENALKENKNYIIHVKSIYEIKYSSAQRAFYGAKIYTSTEKTPLIGRGRFCFATSEYVNCLIGFTLLNQ